MHEITEHSGSQYMHSSKNKMYYRDKMTARREGTNEKMDGEERDMSCECRCRIEGHRSDSATVIPLRIMRSSFSLQISQKNTKVLYCISLNITTTMLCIPVSNSTLYFSQGF